MGKPGGAVSVRDLDAVRGKRFVKDAADYVIVGTGAAGATAARVLTAAGLDIVLVEEGAAPPQTGFAPDNYTAFKSLWRDSGFQVARGRTMMPILQGRAVGGTTVINGAIIHRLPPKVHAEWTADGLIDERLSYARLTGIFDQLDQELSVGPAPEAVLGRNSALMREGVQGIGAKGNLILRNVKDCEGSGRCNQGCPGGRKQSMHRTYIPRATARGARVFATCQATHVEMKGDKAVAVRGRFRDPITKEAGPTLRVEARRGVILAASAIQTPMLLQASRVGGRLAGRRLQAHPGTGVMGVFDEPVNMPFGATQGYETTHFWDERMKFESVGMPLETAAGRMPGFGAELVRRVAEFQHHAQWGVQVRAKAHGRVRRGLLGGASIQYDLTDEDVSRYRLGVRRLIEMFFAAGAREVWPGAEGLPEVIRSPDEAHALDDLPNDPKLFHYIAAHLFGTACMHPDPRHGVVGLDGQVHGTKGLYVFDSSLFPTNIGVNPQHSICAISWALSEELAA